MYMYVWARPIWRIPGGADHTWVTTYNHVETNKSEEYYWYCWGDRHTVGQGRESKVRLPYGENGTLADISRAMCISRPEDKYDHAGITGRYGFNGVCHQVTNRILFSTAVGGNPPLLLNNTIGLYWLSYILYGNYGGEEGNWERVQKGCGVHEGDIIPNFRHVSLMTSVLQLTLGLADNDEGNNRLHYILEQLTGFQQSLLGQKDEMEIQVEQGRMSVRDFATAINGLLTESVGLLAEIVGIEHLYTLFGVNLGEEVYLLDVEIAAQED